MALTKPGQTTRQLFLQKEARSNLHDQGVARLSALAHEPDTGGQVWHGVCRRRP